MSAVILSFPADAIYREVPTLETASTPAVRRGLIDPLSPEEQTNLEAQLADDLFAVIMSRNRHSLRPDQHPKVGYPGFGEPVELEVTPGYKWGTIEAKHLSSLKRAQSQLDWLIDRETKIEARRKEKEKAEAKVAVEVRRRLRAEVAAKQ